MQTNNESDTLDLTSGIPLEQLGEGAKVVGQVGDDLVLVMRHNGRLSAVGAMCTHYGGPLKDGIVVGDTIRCPWHHAAFSIGNGVVQRPPALHDLPCWNVEVRDGRAYIGARQSASQPRVQTRAALPGRVVVIGGGAAGAAAVATLRKAGFDGQICMLSSEATSPVDRPNLSKDYLAGNAPEEWIPLYPDSWYQDQKIDVHLNARVVRIDAGAKYAQVESGERFPYDALLLATGADPVRLPFDDDSLLYLRTLADCRTIIERAEGAKSALVLGASFMGLEVAASLRARGLDVTIVAPEAQPLERVMGAEIGAIIRGIHEKHGTHFRLGHLATHVGQSAVRLDDGSELRADLIVAGVGVRPNIQLARDAGLEVDRGVVVNTYLESSVPGIYAAGDIAQWPYSPHDGHVRVEHWVVAERQGQTAAQNIMGFQQPFDAVPFFWSAHFNTTISYVGYVAKPTKVDIEGDFGGGDGVARFFDGKRLAAVATVGRDQFSLEVETALEGSWRSEHAAGAAS